MINQLRTLLLNQSAVAIPLPGYPGEEFVPADYMPRTLPDGLATVHSLLFGVAPDRAMLNMRLRQLLGLIHSTELAEFVYALDPRVTYWPPRNDSLFSSLDNVPTITNIVGTNVLYIMGSPTPFTDGDKLYYSFLIEVVNGTDVTIQSLTDAIPIITENYTVSAGLSSLVPLPNTDLQFRFQAGVGSKWKVEWLTYPAQNLADLYNNVKSGLTSDLASALFGDDPEEPMLTFRNLWVENPYPPYQLGGAALALGYQTNTLVA